LSVPDGAAPTLSIDGDCLMRHGRPVIERNLVRRRSAPRPRRIWCCASGARVVQGITPDELVRLAPRLKSYLRRPSPSWSEVVDAADWLRHDLGVSKSLWGDACVTPGPRAGGSGAQFPRQLRRSGRNRALSAATAACARRPAHHRPACGFLRHAAANRAKRFLSCPGKHWPTAEAQIWNHCFWGSAPRP
jgi:hypothetical protein